MLKTLNATFRWTFSGTVLHDTVLDLRGYLFFHERPWWGEPIDRNERGAKERVNAYKAFVNGLSTKAAAKSKGLSNAIFADWHTDCSSVAGMATNDIQTRQEEGWLCSHFPALLKYNTH